MVWQRLQVRRSGILSNPQCAHERYKMDGRSAGMIAQCFIV
jgi:hypothetical protein